MAGRKVVGGGGREELRRERKKRRERNSTARRARTKERELSHSLTLSLTHTHTHACKLQGRNWPRLRQSLRCERANSLWTAVASCIQRTTPWDTHATTELWT